MDSGHNSSHSARGRGLPCGRGRGHRRIRRTPEQLSTLDPTQLMQLKNHRRCRQPMDPNSSIVWLVQSWTDMQPMYRIVSMSSTATTICITSNCTCTINLKWHQFLNECTILIQLTRSPSRILQTRPLLQNTTCFTFESNITSIILDYIKKGIPMSKLFSRKKMPTLTTENK
jgi:hypothetical protein